jgi:hypothetical protein
VIKTKVFLGVSAIYSSNPITINPVGETLEQQIQTWLNECQGNGKKIEIVASMQSSTGSGAIITTATILYREKL